MLSVYFMMINESKIVKLIYSLYLVNIIDSLQPFNSRTLTFYLDYDYGIDFQDIRKIQAVMSLFLFGIIIFYYF